MYELFSIVDASHDDPSIFPVLSAPHAAFPFEWEAGDGATPQTFTTKSAVVSQQSGSGWTQLKRLKDIPFTVVVTQSRTVIYCEKFTKGGGWVGFGAGGLAVALVANAVSHARAAARRRGKLLIAQVRHEWLAGVGVPTDRNGRPNAMRLVVDAGTPDRPRVLALDLMLKERYRPDAWAATIAASAARTRLQCARALTAADHDALQDIVTGRVEGGSVTLAGSVPVGTQSLLPSLDPRDLCPAADTIGPADDTVDEPVPPVVVPLNPAGCSACGAPVEDATSPCSRCGHAPATPRSAPGRSSDEDVLNRTTVRAITGGLREQPAAGPEPGFEDTQVVADFRPVLPGGLGAGVGAAAFQSFEPPAAPATPGGSRASSSAHGQGRPAPAEVWAVCAGLVILAALALYPVLRYLAPIVGDLFGRNAMVRAFAALVLEYAVILTGAGAALLLLAVGLAKGSRVSQVLTCVLAGLVALGEVIGSQQQEYGTPSVSTGIAVGSVVVAAVAIGLVAGTPNARAFFAADQRPVGVLLAGVAGAYLGGVAVLDGVLLMVAGAIAHRYLWFGVAFAVVGLVLVAAASPLRAGSTVARAAVVGSLGAFVVVLFALASPLHEASSAGTIIPVGLCVAAVVGLTAPARSRAHFAGQGGSALSSPRRMSTASAVATASATFLVVVMAVVGFSNAGSGAQPASGPVIPEFSSPSDTGFSGSSAITMSDAETFAPDVLNALEGNGTADVCNGGDLPSIDVYDYRIRDVSPATTGTFRVSADVSLSDGSYETVSYLVTDDRSGSACVDPSSFTTREYSPDSVGNGDQPSVPPPSPTVPTDVPAVPSTGDSVPTDAPLPASPSGSVVAYTSDTTPSDASQIVEYQPDGLDADQTAAVQTVIAFMTYINQQNFQPAWNVSTYRLRGSTATSNFRQGYTTSRFYQVEFGQPQTLAGDLIVVPGRFVSKQDPAAQGNPDGVTSCSYWPQYMFTLARSGSHWLIDISGREAGRSELDPLKRPGADGLYLNPVAQREDCS